MRGAQPATSAGARLFAGSPIPALFTALQEGVKKSILRLFNFNLLRDERFQNRHVNSREKKSRIFHVNAIGKLIAFSDQ